MTQSNPRRGILFMCVTTLVFAAQDGISRHLAAEYNTLMVVTIRYWFFAAFVIAISMRSTGGLGQAAATQQPVIQILRGLLLALEIVVAVIGFVYLGLVQTLAIFACYPLLVAALSGPVLGERVGWRRWLAIALGFAGVLVILAPGVGVFSPYAIIPFASALLFALYGLMTRYAARRDSAATSFFWTGVTGAVALTPLGLLTWEPMAHSDWAWMSALCVTGATGHYLLIKAYEAAEASTVQPFAYLHLVFGAAIGVLVFSETVEARVAFGAAIVVAAGVFTILREARGGPATRRAAPARSAAARGCR